MIWVKNLMLQVFQVLSQTPTYNQESQAFNQECQTCNQESQTLNQESQTSIRNL